MIFFIDIIFGIMLELFYKPSKQAIVYFFHIQLPFTWKIATFIAL